MIMLQQQRLSSGFWKHCLYVGVLIGSLLSVQAAEIQSGFTFTDGDVLRASDLNTAIGSATILPGFYTSKTTIGANSLASSDIILVYNSVSGFRNIRLNTATVLNTNWYSGPGSAATTTVVDAGDFILILDSSIPGVRKIAYTNFFGTNSVMLLDEATVISPTAYVHVVNNGTNSRASLSNVLFSVENYGRAFTNLPAKTTVLTNGDVFPVYDASAGSNRTVTVSDIRAKYVTGLSNLVAGGVCVSNLHGLAGVPQVVQWVLVCQSAQHGYNLNDQVDARNFFQVGGQPVFATSYNGTNMVSSMNGGTFYILNRTNTSVNSPVTATNWLLRGYAQYFP